jgi:hypothetical protein
MPAGKPVLGSSSGDRQLLGNDLKDSNASLRHARDCQPTPGQERTGDRRSGTRSARASATNAGLGETYVPTHEGRITWDICREPRHPPLRCLRRYSRGHRVRSMSFPGRRGLSGV